MSKFILCLVFGCLCLNSPDVAAQFRPPEGLPSFVETQILTVGGITYFRHVSELTEWCDRIGSYPVSRDGTNLILAIQKEGLPPEDICLCDTVECGPVPHQDVTSMLGALAPGNYRLRILSTNMNFSGEPLFQVTAVDRYFEIGAASERTLAVSRIPNGNSFQISVAGVSNVNYVLERSGDLLSWIPMRTNVVAPFVHNVPASGQQQFYRVSISQLPLEE